MAYAIDFGAAPREGETLKWADQEYTVVRGVSFTAGTGDRIVSIDWETRCPGCGATVRFKTGARKPWLPKRCKSCNGAEDRDKLERQHYAKKLWSERLLAAKKAAKEGKPVVASKIEEAVLIRGGTVMRCTILWPGGKRTPFDYAPGIELEEEEVTPALVATLPALEAEFQRLKEFDDLMG